MMNNYSTVEQNQGEKTASYKLRWWLCGYYIFLPILPVLLIDIAIESGATKADFTDKELASSSPYLFWLVGAWYIPVLFVVLRSWVWSRRFPIRYSNDGLEVQKMDGTRSTIRYSDITHVSRKKLPFKGLQLDWKEGRCFIPRASFGLRDLTAMLQARVPMASSLDLHFSDVNKLARLARGAFIFMLPIVFFLIVVYTS